MREDVRRNIIGATDAELWHAVTYDIKHRRGGPIYESARYLRQHPAMRELLRRAAEIGDVTVDAWEPGRDVPLLPATGGASRA